LGVISGLNSMFSRNSFGSTFIRMDFNLNRDPDEVARDVQAALSAARVALPTAIRGSPTYRREDPAVYPIMHLALTSDAMTQAQLYDATSTILAQPLSQVEGVGSVQVGGSSLPAVRVEVNPLALFKYGIGLENIRAALASANANSPKGVIENTRFRWQIYANDQAGAAADYSNLIVAYRNGAPVRLSSVAQVTDSVENIGTYGVSRGQPAVIVWVSPQPRANIVETIARVRALLPQLQDSMPKSVHMDIMGDSSVPILASLHDAEWSLGIAVVLVVLVVFAFLAEWRTTLIPGVALPISIIGAFSAMYLLGYSLDNFSIIALTISTGFVVDDTIVVMENTVRHMEMGVPPRRAALIGVQEVGFTVLSMSLSLVAVFSPILFMGGVEGGLFHEFAGTLSITILVSLVVSLALTPMMCSRVLVPRPATARGRFARWSDQAFAGMLGVYERSLRWALRHKRVVMLILAVTIGLNVLLFMVLPKGYLPQEDTGQMTGNLRADPTISFEHLAPKVKQAVSIIQADPAVDTAVGVAGQNGSNTALIFIELKPLSVRRVSAALVAERLQPQLARITGARINIRAFQSVGGGLSLGNSSAYDYIMLADNVGDLNTWIPKLADAMRTERDLRVAWTSEDYSGLESDITFDRDTASRLGLTTSQIDSNLYDAFGQRQVSTIYKSLNQYHVVLLVQPAFRRDPEDLNNIYISTGAGSVSGTQSSNAVAGTFSAGGASSSNALSVATDAARNAALNSIATTGKGSASTGQPISTAAATMIPLGSFARHQVSAAASAIYHVGPFVAGEIDFDLPPGVPLSDAEQALKRQVNRIHLPTRIQGSLEGEALSFEQVVGNEPILILAALVAIYIVLGILYESYAHPFTILSTLPSAGVGAFLALMLCKTELSLMAVMGLFLLIGIVKKNAIMMIDLAIQLEREGDLTPRDAIFKASLLRFRPIMMTTLAALLGALPLAIGIGNSAEFRRPLGISIVGGLIASQILTLYTTPVVYIYVDRARLWLRKLKPKSKLSPEGGEAAPVRA